MYLREQKIIGTSHIIFACDIFPVVVCDIQWNKLIVKNGSAKFCKEYSGIPITRMSVENQKKYGYVIGLLEEFVESKAEHGSIDREQMETIGMHYAKSIFDTREGAKAYCKELGSQIV